MYATLSITIMHFNYKSDILRARNLAHKSDRELYMPSVVSMIPYRSSKIELFRHHFAYQSFHYLSSINLLPVIGANYIIPFKTLCLFQIKIIKWKIFVYLLKLLMLATTEILIYRDKLIHYCLYWDGIYVL